MISFLGGIDLGGSFIKAGLLSLDGQIVKNIIVPAEVEAGIPRLKENLRLVGTMLLESSAEIDGVLAGIGIGSPGTIKYPEGLVTGATPNIPGWIGTNISAIFHDFPCPISADNDANCMGLAEATFGAGRGTSSGFYLTLGTGVGGAIVLNGALLRGANFCAGEFGHMVFQYNGALCKSGRRGCLEFYVNAEAVVRAASERLDKNSKSSLSQIAGALEVKSIFEAFNNNDPLAIDVVSENATMVGVAIGSVVNLLNPEVVVIGGGMALSGEKYINLIRKSVFEFAFESTTSILRIESAKFGNEAGWIGAACLNIR
jgi:glucokinase